ncbi:hypothetical protein B0H14DRAFT_2622652 [Mycena olivaceomarginata]|nr:hypothetical protein B0H14DRAFT_2622652 [Mycena olivaceomarginata]
MSLSSRVHDAVINNPIRRLWYHLEPFETGQSCPKANFDTVLARKEKPTAPTKCLSLDDKLFDTGRRCRGACSEHERGGRAANGAGERAAKGASAATMLQCREPIEAKNLRCCKCQLKLPQEPAPASSTTSSSATSLAVPPISPSMSSLSSISASTSSSGAGAWGGLEAGGSSGEGSSASVSGAASSSRFSSVSTAPSSRSTVATGPFYFNSTQQKFFRSMDMAMASMDGNDVVVIVSSATEMAAAIEKGKKVDHGEDVNMEG